MQHINYNTFKQELEDNMKWLENRTILLTRTGSHSYGTNIENSDTDIKGVAIPPAEYYLGLKSINEYNKSGGSNLHSKNTKDDVDLVIKALNKFVIECMQSVPNNLDILFCNEEDILYINDFGRELRSMRKEFLSKQCKYKFGGYANGQVQRLLHPANGVERPELVVKYGYDTKQAMHAVRLLQACAEILETGDYHTRRPNADWLLEIRNGKYSFKEMLNIIEEEDRKIKELFETSKLPDKPDFDKINKWLIDFNKRALDYDFENSN